MQDRKDADDVGLGDVKNFVGKSFRQCLPVLSMNSRIRLGMIGDAGNAALDLVQKFMA